MSTAFFDSEELNPPTRFYYYHNGKKTDQWIELRLASDEDNKNIFRSIGVKEKVNNIYNPKTRQMDRQTYFDTNEEQMDRYNEAMWDFSIVDWYLVKRDRKEETEDSIPCTRENKILYMRKSPKFSSWVASCLEKLRETLSEVGEAESKN